MVACSCFPERPSCSELRPSSQRISRENARTVRFPALSGTESAILNRESSGGARVRFLVRFQAVKALIFGGFPVENPTKKASLLKALLRGISLSEYGSEGFRLRLRRLSEYGSVAYLVERPTRETRAEQYSDTVLNQAIQNRAIQIVRFQGRG